jgi:hypothetical protein
MEAAQDFWPNQNLGRSCNGNVFWRCGPASIPPGVLKELRQIVASIDPEEPLNHVMAMTEMVERETTQNRMQTILLAGFAGLALIMASVALRPE